MEYLDWIMDNWLIILGAIITITYVIITVTPTKKDDTVFWRFYSSVKAILPDLPSLKKKDD